MEWLACNATGANATVLQQRCCPDEAPLSLAFGTCLWIGIGCSYISQHAKILSRRSSAGISWLMLLIATISNFCSLLNVLLLSDVFECCGLLVSRKQCYEKWIPILQIGMPAINLLPIFCFYLIFYREPDSLAPSKLINETERLSWWRRIVRWINEREKTASR